jgi:hypothetical protein
MHPDLLYQLVQARLAELHHQPDRSARHTATRRAARPRLQRRTPDLPRVPAQLTQRVRTALRARSA